MKWFGVFALSAVFCVCVCCPDGWATHGSKCYHFSREPETWADATTMCQFMKGSLVEIEDAAENTYLITQTKLLGSTVYWIALSDVEEEGTWVWMNSGQRLTGQSFTDWYPGQPDNYKKVEHCASLYRGYFLQWNDSSCHNTNNYICERNNSAQIVG